MKDRGSRTVQEDRRATSVARAASPNAAPQGGGVSRETVLAHASINTVIRRFGFVGQVMYDALVGQAIRESDVDAAEALGNQLKPLLDALMHFVLDVEKTEVSDAPPF